MRHARNQDSLATTMSIVVGLLMILTMALLIHSLLNIPTKIVAPTEAETYDISVAVE